MSRSPGHDGPERPVPRDSDGGGQGGGDGPGWGSMRPLGPAAPALACAVGLVVGWVVRPVANALDATPPLVPWTAAVVLVVVAGVLAPAAWVTRAAIADPRLRLEPHQAVNRLLLARACLVGGALVAGAYAGYALSWLGLSTQLAEQRLVRSGAAALAALAVVAAAALLERACRVRSDDPEA